MYRPAAELAYTAGPGDERHRLRAFIERHRPGVGAEETAAQLAACAQVREQAGKDGSGRAWERRWRSFPRLLVVLVGTAAARVRGAVADLRLAAEKNPATAEMLTAVPAGAARLEDLIQHGPAAPIWHPLSSNGRAYGWTELEAASGSRRAIRWPSRPPPPPRFSSRPVAPRSGAAGPPRSGHPVTPSARSSRLPGSRLRSCSARPTLPLLFFDAPVPGLHPAPAEVPREK